MTTLKNKLGRYIGSKGTWSVFSNNEGTTVYNAGKAVAGGWFEFESNAWWFESYTKAFDTWEEIIEYYKKMEKVEAYKKSLGI